MKKRIKITFQNRDNPEDKMIESWTLKESVSSRAFEEELKKKSRK